jgi:uncharacterized iron-regulated membrane protein
MSGGLRQSMSGLHTWGGLVFGWFLMAIFVSGTLCVFTGPISEWMRGEAREAASALSAGQREQALVFAVRHLERVSLEAREWRIHLSEGRLEWRDASGAERRARFDPHTGAEIAPSLAREVRETAGGWNFVGFHYALHAGFSGVMLVGFVTVALLVALASGLIVHKRIFKDFFTLRLGKGLRSWLDAHNVCSVLTLPFQLMIAYTGLAIFQNVWMPASILYHYGMPGGLGAELELTSPYWDAQRAEGLREQALPRARPARADLPLAALPDLAAKARQRAGLPVEWIARRPDAEGASRLWIGMAHADSGTLPHSRALVFQAVGDPVTLRAEDSYPVSKAKRAHGVLATLHRADFGGWTVKWLWFLCGLAGCLMIATGLILFSQKRARRGGKEFGRATARVYRLIEALNVASVAGMALASIAYFWANRIIPADFPGRAEMEIRVFLLVWAVTPIHALLRPACAWAEQLGLTAFLCLALPLVNLATTGDWLGAYAARGEWTSFGVEVVALVIGLSLAFAAWRAARVSS